MIHSFIQALFLAVLACAVSSTALAQARSQYKTSLPPSAELVYSIKAKQKGIPFDGDAVMRWNVANGKFSASNEASAIIVGKILDSRSEGIIDGNGLAPTVFTEKRFRRDRTTTTFDRGTMAIRFTASKASYPITGGEQDRTSMIWQLIAVARAAPAKVRPGSSWNFFVAGPRDADPWTFNVSKQERITTALGPLHTVHVCRLPPPDSQQQTLDIWLAPSLDWYPVRLRFSDDNGDFIEQTLQKVARKPS
jgi:hypothetical protein